MRVAFIFAHLDDESYGPLGTIALHIKQGDEVIVVSMCRGNRPRCRRAKYTCSDIYRNM
jgi:Uncharacterized proteins, LmbE homologs